MPGHPDNPTKPLPAQGAFLLLPHGAVLHTPHNAAWHTVQETQLQSNERLRRAHPAPSYRPGRTSCHRLHSAGREGAPLHSMTQALVKKQNISVNRALKGGSIQILSYNTNQLAVDCSRYRTLHGPGTSLLTRPSLPRPVWTAVDIAVDTERCKDQAMRCSPNQACPGLRIELSAGEASSMCNAALPRDTGAGGVHLGAQLGAAPGAWCSHGRAPGEATVPAHHLHLLQGRQAFKRMFPASLGPGVPQLKENALVRPSGRAGGRAGGGGV